MYVCYKVGTYGQDKLGMDMDYIFFKFGMNLNNIFGHFERTGVDCGTNYGQITE